MTKMELREAYWIKKNIEKLEERLADLRAVAVKTPDIIKIQGVPHAGDKTADIVSKIVDLEREIEQQLEKYYECIRRIEKAIEKLPAREALLIRLRYIENKNWYEIAYEMNYSWRQVHNIHAEALKMLA